MTPLEFLQTVWPDEGFYCLAFPLEGGGFSHSVCETIAEAAKIAENAKTSKNVYFATHSLKQEQQWNRQHHKNSKGEWQEGWSVRLQTNMFFGKDFFFDIDVGTSGNKYQSQFEAVIALKQFVATCKLPRPMIISSGNGLHVHWIVDKALASNSEWKTLAQRLRQLAEYHKLKIDTHRTVDTSSVLRVPGTFNLKKGLKLRVEALTAPEIVSVQKWADRLGAALEDVELDPSPDLIPDDEMGSNVSRSMLGGGKGAPPSAEVVFETCRQLARMRDAYGDLRQPEWYAAIGALQYAENGREVCHQISKEYPTYTRAYVDAKIDQWHYGPTTCAKLALNCGVAHADICVQCPHVGRNSGPIPLARLMEKAPPAVVYELVDDEEVAREIPDPPMPYKRSKTGQIEVIIEGKSGTYTEVIHPYDIYPLDRIVDEAAETETQIWRVHLPHGKIRTFAIPAATFVDDKALRIKLANNGVYSISFDKLRAFMSLYIQMLQKKSAAQVQHNHLGWIEDYTEFVLPQGIVKGDGALHPVSLGPPASSAKDFIKKRGTLAKQIELMDFYLDRRYVANQFFIGASLASVLFYITGHFGAIVHAAGVSGSSKSSSLFTAASFWGRPEDYVIDGRDDGSTANYRATRTHMLSNLPVMVDEITLIAHEVAKSMALGVSQKPEKGRLNPDASFKKPLSGDKSSITLTTANVSFYSLLAHQNNAGTAAAVRVFELQFEQLKVHRTWQVNAYMRELKENYGHIGEAFVRFVLKNRELFCARVIKVQDELERVGNMQPDERFLFSLAACTLVAIDAAQKLGLLKYDVDMIREWLLTEQLPRLRGVIRDEMVASSPITLLTDYIAEKHGDIVRVDSSTESVTFVPNNRLLGHYDIHLEELTLLKEGFRRWCAQRNQYSQPLLRQLLKEGVIAEFDVQRVLGAGTSLAKGRSMCFTVNMTHEAITAGEVKEKLLADNVVPLRGRKK